MNKFTSHHRALTVVAEDEPLLRMETVDILAGEGFEVYEARNATEAMEHLERLGGVNLLFTDVHMPGERDGLALAREVAQRWPDTRVVICSAWPRPEADAMPVGAFFLSKPFPASSVRKLLR
jgi:CheY-like chemotaxis protein